MSEFTAAEAEDEVLDPAATEQADDAAAPAGDSRGAEHAPAQPEEEARDDSHSESSRADEYLALAQRTQADFENYRKRVARESETAHARGTARLARELLPALDNLERALQAAASDAQADEQLIEGLRLVHRELIAALERVGIERYGESGEVFDPALHEAVAQQPADGVPAGAIVEVYQAGYRLGATVIRPARVLVAA